MVKLFQKKKMKKSETVKFEQLSINLNNLTTTVIKQPKLQETSTFILLKCLIKNNKSKFCNEGTKKEIIPIIIRRLILPMYIPVFCLMCSFLFFKNENITFQKISIFLINLIVLVFIELVIKYTGTNYFLRLFYIIFPLIIFVIIYPLLFYKFLKKI